jgi:choice-of-anchor A domain-containing protein
MRFRNALVALLVVASPAALAAQKLTPYDVFVFRDFNYTYSEVNGRLAVGGNANLLHWRVGNELTPGYSDFGLVVGGNMTSNEGSVAQGQTYAGGTYAGNGTTGFPAAYPAPVGGASPIDFLSESARLTKISNDFAAMFTTGSVHLVNNELNFIGKGGYNVFSVAIADLQNAPGGYDFVTPAGATNVVNVLGSSSSSAFYNSGFFFDCTQVANQSSCLGGTNDNTPADAGRTVWNFNQQTALVFGGPVHGSLMAPNAAVTFGPGDVVGTIVVGSADSSPDGSAEFYNSSEFNGELVQTPEPATLGLVAIGLAGIVGVTRRRKRTT